MQFDIFLVKGENTVSPLSDGRFVVTVTFVQDSTTCLLRLNNKLEGKCKLSLALCYSMEFCEAKRNQLDKRVRKSELSVVNRYCILPRHQKTDRP